MYPLQLQTFKIGTQSISLFVPEITAVQQAYQNAKGANPLTTFPYWAQVWPAALALSQFLLQNAHYIHQKKVLELAAGLGLPSLVAAPFAKSITCTDYVPHAVAIAQQSAQQAGLTNMQCRLINWHHLPHNMHADVLLLSDVNYEPPEFEVLYQIIQQFLERGTTVILSTPQRLMAKAFIQQLLPWCVLQQQIEVFHEDQNVPITVMVLKGK